MRIRTLLTAGALAALCVCDAAQPAAAAVYLGSGFTIPDLTTRTSTINVSTPGLVTSADFVLTGLTHTFMGDLSGSISHNGTTVSFLNHQGGPADLNGNYTIIDGAATTLDLATGSPRASGAYAPITPLSAFDGMTMAGAWTLTITDSARVDTGSLSAWSLNLPRGEGAGFTIDDLSNHTSIITLSDQGIVDDVDLTALGLTHSSMGDLQASLSHNGRTAYFLANQGGASDLNGDYTLGDEGLFFLGQTGVNLQPPGLYRPDQPFGFFNGTSAAGDWVLSVTDVNRNGSTGALDGWDLAVHTHALTLPGGVPEPGAGTLMLGGFGLVGASLRRRRRLLVA